MIPTYLAPFLSYGQIFASERAVSHFSALAGGELYGDRPGMTVREFTFVKNYRVTVDQFKKVTDGITHFNVIAFLHNEDLTAVGYRHLGNPRKSIEHRALTTPSNPIFQ